MGPEPKDNNRGSGPLTWLSRDQKDKASLTTAMASSGPFPLPQASSEGMTCLSTTLPVQQLWLAGPPASSSSSAVCANSALQLVYYTSGNRQLVSKAILLRPTHVLGSVRLTDAQKESCP